MDEAIATIAKIARETTATICGEAADDSLKLQRVEKLLEVIEKLCILL